MGDLVTIRFGRLTALSVVGKTKSRHAVWSCRCDCGVVVEVTRPNLISGATRSCGCLRVEVTTVRSTTHGASKNNGTPEYESWCAMNARVAAVSGRRHRDYAARGITVCRRWKSFENFLVDMGKRPPGKTLDRKNNNLGYSKRNCRWATVSEQNNNKRNNEG